MPRRLAADYRNLEVWKRAHEATLDIYRLTRSFPDEGRFGLTAQLRRAAVSVGANIVEGRSRSTPGACAASVDIALGSAGEVDYLLLVAHDLGYLALADYAPLAEALTELRPMLGGLRNAILRNFSTTSRALTPDP